MRYTLSLSLLLLVTPTAILAGCNEWTTNGPWGGNVTDLVIDPTNPQVLYAAIFGDKAYKSTDGGDTWFPAGDGLVGFQLVNIVLDPVNTETLYAGSTDGVSKSIDGATTWFPAGEGLPSNGQGWVFDFAIDPITPSTIYTIFSSGFYRGVFKSMDGADSWSSADHGIPPGAVSCLAINPQEPLILYAGGPGDIYMSTDGGDNWADMEAGIPDGAWIFALAIDPVNPLKLYAGTYGAGGFKSGDGGASWMSLGDDLPPWIHSMIVDPFINETVYAGTDGYGVFRSDDGGVTWNQTGPGIRHLFHAVNAIALHPSIPGTLYAGNGGNDWYSTGGIYKSTDRGGSWNPAYDGIAHADVYDVAVDPFAPQTLYAAIWDGGIHKSTDGGDSWVYLESYPSNAGVYNLAVDPYLPDTVYAASSRKIFKSVDAGATWIPYGEEVFTGVIPDLEIHPLEPNFLYATGMGQGVYRSTNGGEAWLLINEGLPSGHYGDWWALALHPEDSQAVLVSDFALPPQDMVFKTTNGGDSWSPSAEGLDYQIVLTFSPDPINTGVVYAAGHGGPFRSTDWGDSWTVFETDISDISISCLTLDPHDSMTLYAGGFSADYPQTVFKSTDSAVSWRPLCAGLPPKTSLDAIVIDSQDRQRLYAATNRGVFTITQSLLSGDCNCGRIVTISEVQRCINMFLNVEEPACGADINGDGVVSIGEIQHVINAFLL